MDEVAGGLAAYFGLKLGGAIAKLVPSIITGTIAKSGASAGASAASASAGGASGGLVGSLLSALIPSGAVAAAGAWLGEQFSHHIIAPTLERFGSSDAELYKNWTFFGEGGLFQASLDNAKFHVDDFVTYLKDFGDTHGLVMGNITSGNALFGGSFDLLTALIKGDSDEIDTSVNGIKDAFQLMSDTWATEHPLISAGFDSIYETVKNSQIGSAWSAMMGGILTVTDTILGDIEKRFGTAFNFLTGGIKDLIKGADDLNNTLGKGVNTQPKMNIAMRASGGFVDKGDLFLAGEAGPEIVTSFGGDSAVMNMDQIISAISASVTSASGGDITIPVILDGGMLDKVIVTAQQRQSLRSGR